MNKYIILAALLAVTIPGVASSVVQLGQACDNHYKLACKDDGNTDFCCGVAYGGHLNGQKNHPVPNVMMCNYNGNKK